MLKLKYLFENFELAKLALTNWEHDEDTLDEYLKYFRISSNAVYPFAMKGKRHFLRLSPVEEKQKENLTGELEFLQYLVNAGYGAMKPMAAKNGELMLTLNTKWGGYYASVFEGVAGISIEDTDYREEIMTAYGKALGRLHNLSMDYQPENRKWSYVDALAWVKKTLAEYQNQYPEKGLPLEKMQKEAEAVEQELSKLKQTKETFGLVHYDFEPDNVFYKEEDNSCQVIDFEDGMYHFFLVDIEQVLDSLSEELEGDAFEQTKKYFLQGYESEKALEPDYELKCRLMRRFCNLFSYARLVHCIAEEVSDAPDWMVSLRNRLTLKIQYLENIK
ncbi:MAG: phosphotransferase [Lachnospiraceae bacterium]|nr:phosphotransferase [Lachnospiraceae bacterium]